MYAHAPQELHLLRRRGGAARRADDQGDLPPRIVCEPGQAAFRVLWSICACCAPARARMRRARHSGSAGPVCFASAACVCVFCRYVCVCVLGQGTAAPRATLRVLAS